MKPSEKDRQPADEGDLQQTERIRGRRVRKPRKPQGKTASKHSEDKKAEIAFMSPAEQIAFYAWLERGQRASSRMKLHGAGPSAKNNRRPAPAKPNARRTAVTQAADMDHYALQTGGVVMPEDISAGAMPPGIMELPSSDLGMNSPTTLWDSSVDSDQPSSDPHAGHCPLTPRDSIDLQSPHDGRKSVTKKLPRRRAPVLPPIGLARPVNRLNAAMAMFGAFGALAWVLVLTSGTQPSRLSAKDSHGQLAISEVKSHRGAEASSPAPVLARLPQQAANPDRLSRSIRAPQPAAADRLPTTRSLSSPIHEKVSESDIPMPRKKPSTQSKAAAVSKRVLEQSFDEETPEFPAPANTGIDDDTGVGDIDIGGAVSALEIDEAREQASDEAPDEVAATRSAAVSTDVNMRARPDNAAAVITVVPGKSDVEVVGCDDWCEVVVAGKRGWIYHRFVGAAHSSAGISGSTGVAGTTGRVAEATIPSAESTRRAPVAIDGIGRLASLGADDLQKNLRTLDLGDVRKLKTTCAEVLRSSAAYSANTRAVCKLVTSQ